MILLKLLNVVSFGKRFKLASLVYVGLAFLLAGTLCDVPVAQGQGSNCLEVPCPDGQQCCSGTCIDASFACCDDGTYGDPSEGCKCCTYHFCGGDVGNEIASGICCDGCPCLDPAPCNSPGCDSN
jgi:hypothetical protein